MNFSHRQGIDAAKALQFDSMDLELRTSLWNVFHMRVVEQVPCDEWRDHSTRSYFSFFKGLWLHFFKWPLNTMPKYGDTTVEEVRLWYFRSDTPWNRVYDFVEFVANELDELQPKGQIREFFNHMLTREASAYRFVGDTIGPLTSEAEIRTIEEAGGWSGPVAPVSAHIRDATRLLSSRTEPNFRNSMKESISAVESLVKILSGDDKGTLGKVLEKIGPRLDLHPSLITAFKALYGYSNDADGIRHGMKDEKTPEMDDARYFLVTCSAFVCYLVEKARKLDMLPT